MRTNTLQHFITIAVLLKKISVVFLLHKHTCYLNVPENASLKKIFIAKTIQKMLQNPQNYQHTAKVVNFGDECIRHKTSLKLKTFLFIEILTFTSSVFSNDAVKIGRRSHFARYERLYFLTNSCNLSTYLFSIIYNFCPFCVEMVACLSFQHLFQTSNRISKFRKSRLSVPYFSSFCVRK